MTYIVCIMHFRIYVAVLSEYIENNRADILQLYALYAVAVKLFAKH